MDNKIAFFDDLKPTSLASPGDSNRPLNAILNFLYRFNTGDLIKETRFFEVNFFTGDDVHVYGSLFFFFSIDHANKNKTSIALLVDIKPIVDSFDEDDYEIITDLDSNSDYKLYYQYGNTVELNFSRPELKHLSILPSSLAGSIKQHEIFTFIYELILKKIWTDAETFKNEYRNNILFIVFLYLSKHIDFKFNNAYESFVGWLSINGIHWFENAPESLHTKEVYCHLITYSINLAYYILKILLSSKIQRFSTSPSKELVYFFADRTDLRSTHNSIPGDYNQDEDEEDFSNELTSNNNSYVTSSHSSNSKGDAYSFIGSDTEDSENKDNTKDIIAEDFNYSARKKELYALNKALQEDLIDVPTMSLNQAWNLIQDKWQFYLKSFSSRYFNLTDFVRTAIFNQLKSLKGSIFSNWFDIKSGTGQLLYIDSVSYDTFKIEFLSYEAKQIQTYMKDRLKTQLSFEILEPQPKYLKNLGIFNERFERQIINKISNNDFALKANGILDGISKDLINNINLHISNDIYLVNYFSKIDRDLEPPNYQLLDSLLRISILNLLMITSDVSLSELKKLIKNLVDPDVEYSAFDTFDKKQYQNQLIKELSTSFRSRIDPAELLNLKM